MKTIVSLAIAVVTFTAAPAAQALDLRPRIIITSSFVPQHHHHCAPSYVCTKELYRRIESQWVYDNFGGYYTVNVLVITYADYYSDGSARSYTRTYRV
jgi:hypothetical protein